MSSEKKLAEIQKAFMENDALNADREAIHNSWFDDTTTDYWRHERMYETIRPIAETNLDSSWVTIGDGRFGLDSIRLRKIFRIKNVLATDIAENMLRISKEKKYITDYSVENAEALSFPDRSFDIVFCKETFHHFPKPFLGLYEMLRVANKAVVLIEPAEAVYTNDLKSSSYIKSAIKLLLSKITKQKYLPYLPENYYVRHGFETAGNYIYSLSVREMERLMHGMDLGGVAYKRFSDFYVQGCEFEKAEKGSPAFDAIQKQLEDDIVRCKKNPHFYQPNMVTVILFRDEVEEKTKKEMIANGFTFLQKLPNPYA